jgi:hypothetical protein
MRIAGIDSGKLRDSFAFVGVEVKQNNIYVLGVKTWLGRNYLDVENLISDIHATKPFDFYSVEINNTGEHVYEELKYRHRIPNVIPVFTTREVKDQSKINQGRIMPKNQMVLWLARMFQNHRIKFPSKTNKHIEELKRQISNFSEHITEAGQVSYRADGSEHDDTVMALMLACFIGRNFIKETDGMTQPLQVVSRQYQIGSDEDDVYGSGIPVHTEQKEFHVIQP